MLDETFTKLAHGRAQDAVKRVKIAGRLRERGLEGILGLLQDARRIWPRLHQLPVRGPFHRDGPSGRQSPRSRSDFMFLLDAGTPRLHGATGACGAPMALVRARAFIHKEEGTDADISCHDAPDRNSVRSCGSFDGTGRGGAAKLRKA